MIRFESPAALLLLPAIVLFLEPPLRALLPAFLQRQLQGVPFFRFSSLTAVNTIPPSFRQRIQAKAMSALSGAAFLFLVIGLARPQTGTEFVQTEASARDILLVLDVSGSMEALDFAIEGKRVDRLTALKAVVQDFIRNRTHDRIGLVVFGTEVFTQCPLTLDHRVLTEFVSSLEVGMAGDATALGDGLGVGVKRLREIPGESKVIVLVTDGLKTAGQLEPLDAAEIARKLGIKIYTVGIGGKEPAPFKTTNIFGFETLEYREVPVDEKSLKEIAAKTGGRYFHASRTEELAEIYGEIDLLEERVESAFDYVEYEEHFFPFVLIGLALFVIGEALRRTALEVVP